MSKKFALSHFLKHPPKKEGLIKFVLLLCVLLAYGGYLSWEYGVATGGLVALLTWSFFVLCTPIADAGFLLDFPVRLITGFKMQYCEIIVWAIAISVNLSAVYFSPESYDKTFITNLFYKILTQPYPYWGVIILSALGTFLSVKFGDEMIEAISHKDRDFHHKHGFQHQLIIIGTMIVLIIIAYYFMIESLGLEIPVL